MEIAIAIAQIRSSITDEILGYITFNETNKGTYVWGELKGLVPGEHAMHIHERGDPRKCCSALGDHYNPFQQEHGLREAKVRHVGDLGNIFVAADGTSKFSFIDEMIKIRGQYSIIGRSLVIHENKDDGGFGGNVESKKNGNSGARIAYGIIGYA